MEWEEPHDSALYCIQTDGNHMIASGSSHYGVVRLWDKRQAECLQVCTVYLQYEIHDITSHTFTTSQSRCEENKHNAAVKRFHVVFFCVQFFQLTSDSVSSPVYCLRFSSSHLYAALATTLHSLDFSKNPIYIR